MMLFIDFPDHLSPEEKLQRRKLKNRVAAQNARDKKRAKMEDMEEKLKKLESEAKRLREENQKLKLINERLSMSQMPPSPPDSLTSPVSPAGSYTNTSSTYASSISGDSLDENNTNSQTFVMSAIDTFEPAAFNKILRQKGTSAELAEMRSRSSSHSSSSSPSLTSCVRSPDSSPLTQCNNKENVLPLKKRLKT